MADYSWLKYLPREALNELIGLFTVNDSAKKPPSRPIKPPEPIQLPMTTVPGAKSALQKKRDAEEEAWKLLKDS